ncbi:EscU/YscU/HrcU family type III secretion system export apparatus switch protein [Aporhodopirellula aestuarii]|uniref:EscU/YscU/HrcU family type III secretion system export apparatus switch protein n=1 Tax=Aporhodopirellula aestuarii TaxID=2950107 RepID=A0ABT0U0B7_9BACT|nr:EscU/YscU/HrcU family type III secretion system export apparatus switch protein [Aporhodopirellula aestuarii]MCM2369923.1 EscU/YscU/HrcU family type III secretion system export apparatus switch protein [Aporhodopirellula aestuarii]
MSDGDKKHFATERKRRQAREKGDVPKSQDLTSASLLLAALGAMYVAGGKTCAIMAGGIESALSNSRLIAYTPQEASSELLRLSTRLAIATAPILLLMFAGAIAINVTQAGLILSPEKLMPKLSNISPLSGAKRILSVRGLMRLLFGMVKVGLIGTVAYYALRSHRDSVVAMASMSVPQIASTMFHTLLGVCLWIGSGLFILALLEWAFQKWKSEQDMMMTDQELRDEMKDTEGDPQVAARRRQVARQLAMNRASNDVPTADVVVSNPTELAIAIKYDPKTMPAPIVVAKGAGLIAQKIRRVALEHSIPVVERKPLAQFLYKNVEVGQEIPADQYQAVAEVLRYVYQLQGRQIPQAA